MNRLNTNLTPAEGAPSEDMRYMVAMFQSSLLQAVTDGNDKRYLDLGGGPT